MMPYSVRNGAVQYYKLFNYSICSEKNQLKDVLMYCMRGVRIWNFPGPYFPEFGLNTESYGVYPFSMRENMDQKNSGKGQFSRSAV